MNDDAFGALRAAYRDYSASYRGKRRSADVEIWTGSITLDWLARLQPLSVDILDIGCGGGWLAGRLTAYGPVSGIDDGDVGRSLGIRALARGEYHAGDRNDRLLPRYVTGGVPSPRSKDGFSVALALNAPTLPSDFFRFCASIADILADGGWFVWSPPTHQAFNETEDWGAVLGASFQLVDKAVMPSLLGDVASDPAAALILLAQKQSH
ncbi:class I SAM-dependent methyltransferase [Vitreimonas flagellata]|jgi:SAM-dependent methyltransferase|uniref:class I SAM-dependent methyltransferase n=1 Tax=Vitreimonas flagellata TaxID=2560861 RepID=UPI0010755CB9|nr:class I SAM-dependent methyltransferase [Vitreimonas flagellata]